MWISTRLFLCIGFLGCIIDSCHAQVNNVRYTPLRVAVIIDTVAYSKLSQSIPGWWLQRTLNQGGIGGVVPVNVTTYFSVGGATPAWATNITLGMIANGLPDVIVMLCLDNVVPATAALMEPLGVSLIVPSAPSPSLYRCSMNYKNQPPCTKPNTRRYQYVHGISASAENYFEPFISLLKIKKAPTLAYLQPIAMTSDTAPPPTIYQEWADSVKSISLNNKITCITIPVRFPLPLATDLPGLVNQLVAANVDALIGVTGCQVLLPYFQSVDFNVRAMSFLRCIDTVFPAATDPRELSRYLTSPAQWDARLTGLSYSEYMNNPVSWFPTIDPLTPSNSTTISSISSPQQFNQFAIQQTNGTIIPDYTNAALAATFEFIEGSVFNWRLTFESSLIQSLSNTTNGTITIDHFNLNRQMQLLYEPSMFGLLSTNRYGINQQKEMILIQKTNMDINEIISPISAATIDFIYPMPTWKERIYVHSMYGTPEEQIICILIGIFTLFTIILGIIMCIHRHSKQIRASSLTFSLMMAFGGIVGYLAILTWPIENNDTTCHARSWLWCLGFQLFFAPLLAKSYRIASIFNVKKLSATKHDDKLVIWHTFLIAAPQLLILMIWSIDSPLQAVVRVQDVLRPALNYADCDSARATNYVWASVAYSAICLLAGCLLAYRVRAAFEIFNDAKYIANSVYIFTLTAVVIAGVQAGINSATQMKAIFMIRSIGTLIAYCSSVSLLLVPRVVGVIHASGASTGYQTKVDDERTDRSLVVDDGNKHSYVGQMPVKHHRASISPTPNAHINMDKRDSTHERRDSLAQPSNGIPSNTTTPTNGGINPKTRQAFT